MSVKYELIDDIAVVTLDRPDRYNAIDESLAAQTVESLALAGTEARCVVLTGAGKAFCSGADLSGFVDEYDSGGPDLAAHLEQKFHPMVAAISESPIPTVAAVNGVAAGAGMGLALGCDLRVVAESAYFTSAFTAIGLAPDSGSTWLLPQHLGVSLAMELALTNRRMYGPEAKEWGLCVEVAPDGDTLQLALGYAANLSDLSTDALVTTRRLIRGSGSLSFAAALDREKFEQGRLGMTAEHAEGVAAFLEKRQADFRNPT